MKLLKALIAVLLLPCFHTVWLLAASLVASSDSGRVPWIPLAVFVLSISTWVLVYFLFPRPTWFYVLGHEVTHAAAILASGGRVRDIKVRSDGGQVVADRTSAFIALSPYLIPFYPVVFGIIWVGVVYFLPEWHRYNILFLVVWGLAWGFHFTFTTSLLKQGQSDFESQGTFFSWVVILLCNAGWILGIAYFWTRPFPLDEVGPILARSLLQSYSGCWELLQAAKDMVN